jgi:hypothetical protein
LVLRASAGCGQPHDEHDEGEDLAHAKTRGGAATIQQAARRGWPPAKATAIKKVPHQSPLRRIAGHFNSLDQALRGSANV